MTAATTESIAAAPLDAFPRRRILIGAYAVSPVRGSEPGMGWHLCRSLAAYHDLTVLCSPGTPGPERNAFRDEIESHVRRHGPVPGLTFRFVDHPFWSYLCQREQGLRRRTVYYSGYAAWQRAAYRAALGFHRREPL